MTVDTKADMAIFFSEMEKKGIDNDAFTKMISDCIAEFNGLVTEYGAATMVAEKHGVRLDKSPPKPAAPAPYEIDGFTVDTSRQYDIIAGDGQCKFCNQFKTWGFTIKNEKSGKNMPGHVDKDGYKIGDGQCLKYQKPKNDGVAFTAGGGAAVESLDELIARSLGNAPKATTLTSVFTCPRCAKPLPKDAAYVVNGASTWGCGDHVVVLKDGHFTVTSMSSHDPVPVEVPATAPKAAAVPKTYPFVVEDSTDAALVLYECKECKVHFEAMESPSNVHCRGCDARLNNKAPLAVVPVNIECPACGGEYGSHLVPDCDGTPNKAQPATPNVAVVPAEMTIHVKGNDETNAVIHSPLLNDVLDHFTLAINALAQAIKDPLVQMNEKLGAIGTLIEQAAVTNVAAMADLEERVRVLEAKKATPAAARKKKEEKPE